MKELYRLPEVDDKIQALGEKVTNLLVKEAESYAQAMDALHAAQEMLLSKTKPVII